MGIINIPVAMLLCERHGYRSVDFLYKSTNTFQTTKPTSIRVRLHTVQCHSLSDGLDLHLTITQQAKYCRPMGISTDVAKVTKSVQTTVFKTN